MSQTPAKPNASERILSQLRHPLKLRLVLCTTVICVWYALYVMPLVETTQATSTKITAERKRIATAREIETLKKELLPQEKLVPAGSTINELMRHLIDHLRSSPLKLNNLSPEAPKDLGPYEAIGIQLALEGPFSDLSAFLAWIENEARPLRVDSVKIDPNPREPGKLKALIKLLSVAEKQKSSSAAKAKPASTKPEPSKPAK